MSESVESKIEQALLNGEKRKDIFTRLKKIEEPNKVLFHLNNSSDPKARDKYKLLVLALAFFLLFFTSKLLLALISLSTFDLLVLLNLVVPMINFYLLREILRFKRIGYQFLFVLSLVSLVNPIYHSSIEFPLLLIIAALSGVLFFKMFPKSQLIDYQPEQ